MDEDRYWEKQWELANEETDIAYVCDICDGNVYYGDTYYDIDGLIICEDCIEKYLLEQAKDAQRIASKDEEI